MTSRTSSRSTAKRAASPDHPVTTYARDVVAGRIVAGRAVRLACARHLRDLKDGRRGLRFDRTLADNAIDFFAKFLVLDNDEPFVLHGSHVFIVGSLFGWIGADGCRRFRHAYIEMGKGNAKTPLLAGIGLYGITCDGEPAAEVYSAASTKDQADIMFSDAVKMAQRSHALARRLDITADNIACGYSFFRPLSSEGAGKSGQRVHFALIDEIHEHENADVVDKLGAGMKGRPQPMTVEITNSGYDRQSVCWQHHEYSLQVLDQVLDNDEWFAYVCQLDVCEPHRVEGKTAPVDSCPDCDDWQDERCWPKANPYLGRSVTPKYLRSQVTLAQGMPAKAAIVKRLNCCIWTEGVTRWFSADVWKLGGVRVDPEDLRGRRCVLGLDLSTTDDLTAAVLLFPDDEFFVELDPGDREDEGDDPEGDDAGAEPRHARTPTLAITGRVDALAFCWCPEEGVAVRSKRDRVPYGLWREQGHLEATPGNVIDYRYIRRRLKALRDVDGYDVAEICYDPAFATQLALQLQDEDGFTVVPVSQGFDSLNEPSMLLEALVAKGALRHGNHPVLAWAAANVVPDRDSGGRTRPSKRKSTERIDPIAALVTGLKRVPALRWAGSVYETRKVDFVSW